MIINAGHLRLYFIFWIFLLFLLGCTAVQVPNSANEQAQLTAIERVPSLRWQVAIGEGASAPAVISGDVVVVASDTAVIALEPTSGEIVWQIEPNEGVWPRSITANNKAVFIGVPGGLIALDSIDGQILWQQETIGEILWPPLVTGDTLFAGTAFVGPGVAPQPENNAWLYAFDLGSGEKLWEVETAVYTLVTPTASENSVIAGGSFLNDADIDEGGYVRLHAFDRQNGKQMWQTERQDGFLKSLATDGERLYFLAYTDMLYALNLKDGRDIWQYPTENWSPGFTFEDGILYFGSDNAFVHAVDGKTGTAVWRKQQEGIFNSPRSKPAISGDILYFQNNDNRLYALEKDNGTQLWQTEPQSRSRVAPTVGFGFLYLLDQSGVFYAFHD